MPTSSGATKNETNGHTGNPLEDKVTGWASAIMWAFIALISVVLLLPSLPGSPVLKTTSERPFEQLGPLRFDMPFEFKRFYSADDDRRCLISAKQGIKRRFTECTYRFKGDAFPGWEVYGTRVLGFDGFVSFELVKTMKNDNAELDEAVYEALANKIRKAYIPGAWLWGAYGGGMFTTANGVSIGMGNMGMVDDYSLQTEWSIVIKNDALFNQIKNEKQVLEQAAEDKRLKALTDSREAISKLAI